MPGGAAHPIGIAGGLNVYAYPSDPVGMIDPPGLEDRPAWATGLEVFFGGIGLVGGGIGGFTGGGGLAVLTTGPGAIITGPPAAFALGAAGSPGGLAFGTALGAKIADGIMYAISRFSRGPGGCDGGFDIGAVAQRIGGGHAYGKHLKEGGEFYKPGIKTREQLQALVQRVIEQAVERTANGKVTLRYLERGRIAFWDDATGRVVLYNPKDPDWGSVFLPKGGKRYFLKELK